MKIIKLILIRILIIYVILYTILASITSCFARAYDSACGEYVSQYARDFIATYCTPETKTAYVQISEPNWTGGSMGQGTFECCCTTGVKYMYELALGVNLYELDFSPVTNNGLSALPSSPNWIEITSEADLQPGDIVKRSGHTEMYIGDGQRANFGNSPYSGVVRTGASLTSAGGSFTKAFRLASTVEVNPTGTIAAVGGASTINYSNFFFNGIPDGKYSLASQKSIFSIIIDVLANILDYLIGILTYIVRIVFVGFTAIFDNLLNWTVNTVMDTGTTAPEAGLSPTETSGTETSDRSVTIETLLFNNFDLLNINIFKTEGTEETE